MYINLKDNRADVSPEAFVTGQNQGTAATKVQRFRDKYYTENLSFPLNVAGDSQEGHYIIFSILEQNKAKLLTFAPRKGANKADLANDVSGGIGYGMGTSAAQRADIEAGAEKRAAAAAGKLAIEGSENFRAPAASKAGLNNSIQLAQNATTKLSSTIALYMPASVSVSYASKYGDQEIGVLAETGAAAIKNFMETQGSTVDKLQAAATAGIEGAGQGMKQAGIKVLDQAAPGAAALIAIHRGKIITPRMELMFEGIGRREFSYVFTMIPKSAEEAKHIEKIVTRFKHAMAANYSTADFDIAGAGSGADGVREMDIPSFFDIEYMYKTKKNDHLNKISTCVLTRMDVEYGAERFKTYAGGVPQTTKISLSFAELNIITKKHIEAGY